MRRSAWGPAVALVTALAARPSFGGSSIPVITEIRYENGLTGMAEHAGWATGTNPRHVTIILSTPASEVTEVRFNDVDVNSPGLAPVVTDRFVPATDTEVDALGNSDPNAIRVEVPPRLWPLDTPTRAWPDLTSVTVLSSAGKSVGVDFQYLRKPVVSSYIIGAVTWAGNTLMVWPTAYIPTDAMSTSTYDFSGDPI